MVPSPKKEPSVKVQAPPTALKKDRFFKEHDKNEGYTIIVHLRYLKLAAHCPLLNKYEKVLVKMDRGSTKRIQKTIQFRSQKSGN